jgi:hypothetical protein
MEKIGRRQAQASSPGQFPAGALPFQNATNLRFGRTRAFHHLAACEQARSKLDFR